MTVTPDNEGEWVDPLSSIAYFFTIRPEHLFPAEPDQLANGEGVFGSSASNISSTGSFSGTLSVDNSRAFGHVTADNTEKDILDSLGSASSPKTSTGEIRDNLNISSEPVASNKDALPPKIGTRFSRESIRVLKQWFNMHSHHPFPSDKDKEMLRQRTGLSKTQVTTWLANTRRRCKATASFRSKPSSSVSAATNPVSIPHRPGTPAVESSQDPNADPLTRWVESPPESEPATLTAISRAVNISSPGPSGISNRYEYNLFDDGSAQSLYNTSSASSAGTSSDSSRASANSHTYEGSLKAHPRRRRRPQRRAVRTPLTNSFNKFQCTFCTETFRGKHDWQRHEKSLHLPLEKWVCTPLAPRHVNPENGGTCCMFCGVVEPSDAHIESHNPSACQERAFSRKDHLKQHLRLVHNAELLEWTAHLWKASLPEIRSRCGFCGICMDTWALRADHLADHFKMGQTMAAWEGDWGFEDFVFDMVENSIPPYLIEDERNTPWPFAASISPAESPRNAYELISLELVYFLRNFYDNTGTMPGNDAVQLEACRIILASETLPLEQLPDPSCSSWLRDLLTSREDIAQQAQFCPIRSRDECRLSVLKINGQGHLFEECPLEFRLCNFVQTKLACGSVIVEDHELQEEACRIVEEMQTFQTTEPLDFVTNWLVKLICSSKNWLSGFHQRTNLSLMEMMGEKSTHINNELQAGLSGHMGLQKALPPGSTFVAEPSQGRSELLETMVNEIEEDSRPAWIKTTLSFLNDANFDRWLTRELRRWVTATMSPNNPNSHVPSDGELQHQARWILYNSDDRWNQTAADNSEWLRRFKHNMGLTQQPNPSSLPTDSLPDLQNERLDAGVSICSNALQSMSSENLKPRAN